MMIHMENLQRQLAALRTERDALKEENSRLREALETRCKECSFEGLMCDMCNVKAALGEEGK